MDLLKKHVIFKLLKKTFFIFGILIIIFFLGIVLYYLLRPQSIPVLSYHDIKPKNEMSSADKEDYFVDTLEGFEQQMKYIYEQNYKTLTMEEFYCWMKEKCEQPKNSVLITFDDGFASIYHYILPILKKYEFNATSFVITSRIKSENEVSENYNYLTLEMMEELKNTYDKLEFHSHSHDLHRRTNDGEAFVNVVNEDIMKEDSLAASEMLDTNIVAYPFGSYNDKYIKVLKESGYKMGFTYEKPFYRARQDDDLFKIPRVSIGGDLPFSRFKIALEYGLFSRDNLPPR